MNEKRAVEECIAANLLETNRTISTAESCTGGLIAARLINVPGISASFIEGYVTYANSAKEKLLGVRGETLRTCGAVSPECAREMAAGCARSAGTDCSVVSTGIAGPDGGTPEKPVGLVYLACQVNGEVFVQESHFTGSRLEIRRAAAEKALELLLAHL